MAFPQGGRRKLVEDCYRTLNLARQPDIAMLLPAVNEATVRLTADGDSEGLSYLIRLIEARWLQP